MKTRARNGTELPRPNTDMGKHTKHFSINSAIEYTLTEGVSRRLLCYVAQFRDLSLDMGWGVEELISGHLLYNIIFNY